MNRSILLAFLALAALLPSRPASAGWARDPSVNQPIAVGFINQDHTSTAPDGEGGVLIAWSDDRTGSFGTGQDIYLQRLSAKGVPLWTANGVAVCTANLSQSLPVVVSDGAGGAILAWLDNRSIPETDVYAQRVNASGVPQWTPNGVPVCVAGNPQSELALIPDGLGGAIAAWRDNRTGDGGDIYAQRVNGAGAALWTPNGVALTGAAGTQQSPAIVSDGAGGAIGCWVGLGNQLYTQRVDAAGTAQWTAGGVQITSDFSFSPSITTDGAGGAVIAWVYIPSQGNLDGVWAARVTSAGQKLWGIPEIGYPGTPLMQISGSVQNTLDYVRLASDGVGGAIAVWSDRRNFFRDLYARKVNASGAAQWANHGVAVCTAPQDQAGWHPIIPDGHGGAIITWHDPRVDGTTLDVYAQRLDPNGVGQWGISGKLLSTAVNSQSFPTLATDGRDGAVVAWQDYRASQNPDIYAQRVDLYGHLGDPSPEIAWVKDVPSDQGERVRIRWNASYRDTMPTLEVEAYGIWRRVSDAAAANALLGGARLSQAGESPVAERRILRAEPLGAQTIWWEGVGTVLARGEPWYTFAAETFQDSTAAGNPLTVFMVDAHDAYVPAYWSSLPDSGYSVDNLPPAVPAAFTGSHQGGATYLDWNANLENDLAAYYLYRGATADFMPSPGNRIATPTSSDYVDPGPGGSYYKLSAVDIHGNESGFASFSATTDVVGDVPLELALGRPSPNPAYATVTIHFALPQAGLASLAIFDASGRRVRRLHTGHKPAGTHTAQWDLRDDGGAVVAAGLYFVRLEVLDRRLTRRLVTVR